MLVAPALNEDVEHHPVLIHCPPEPVLLPRDFHGNLVQMPCVSGTGQPTPDLVGDALAELQPPLPYGFVADRDAARGEDLVHMAQAQGEAEVEPDRIADDLGRPARLSGSFLLYKAHGLDSTRSDAFPDASDMSRSQAMPHQNTVFRQLANRLPWAALERAIGEHRADRGVRKLRTR